MESNQYPQEVAPKGFVGWRPQSLVPNNATQTAESDEGGLNLGQVVGALRRRLPVIAGVTVLVASAAMLKASTSTPIYQSRFEILTKPVTVEAQVLSSLPQTLSNKDGQQAEGKGLDQTKLVLLKSPRILSPIAKELKAKYPGISYDVLAAGLVITPLPNSEILAVSYQDPDPAKVKDVLKLVADAYLNYSLEERLADVRQGIDFVNAQLPQLQQRVGDIQDKLQTFRQQYNLIDPDSTSKQLADQGNTVAQQRLDTQIRLNEARALYNDLGQQLSQRKDAPVSSSLRENSRYQTLLGQILNVESDIAKESALFKEDTPNIQVLQDQQQNLLPLLQREGQRVQEEVGSKIRELEARDRILTQAQTLLNQRVKQLSVVSRQYVDIQQELKIATENLNQFLTKREALRIDAGQRKTPWQILTAVAEPVPSSANVKRSTILGAILGLLMGVGVALLLDKLSNVLHSPDEIKETSKLPILGVVPFNTDLEDMQKLGSLEKLTSVADLMGLMQQVRQKFGFNQDGKSPAYSSSPFLEAFRSLYTNIRLLNSDTRIQSFVISSSAPGEGKSTVSIHLALAAAALGQRVLLVDTDLRLPQIHNRLGLMNSFGLSNLIASEFDYERVIQQSPIESNLFVLTAGQIPPDPTKLLSSQKMQNLMEKFKDAFDLVIYDTPPLLGLADTKLISSKTDGIVMVVGLGKTKVSTLSQALDSIKPFPVAMLGIVANGSKDYKSTIYDTYHRYHSLDQSDPTLELETMPLRVKQPEE